MWIDEHNIHPHLTPGKIGYLTLIEIPDRPDRYELRADPNMGVALSVPGSGRRVTPLGRALYTRRASSGRCCVRRLVTAEVQS
jgi:hypothetical protein